MVNIPEKAEKILKGETALPRGKDLEDLVKELKGGLHFGHARKILERAVVDDRDEKVKNRNIQQLALCTYKDEELRPADRFKAALDHLEGIGLNDPKTTDPETLSLGGAVFKRKWRTHGRTKNLQQALFLYQAAWERNPEEDMGYGGVNAAYILDILSHRSRVNETRTATAPAEADRLAGLAKKLRQDMLDKLPRFAEKRKADKGEDLNGSYWYVVTLAEIYFGLGEFDKAEELLASAKTLGAKEWERETTFQQLIHITELHGFTPPDGGAESFTGPWKALAAFFDENPELAFSSTRGKVGLALSGGGFRASFYHLGVLARLAEMGVLESVEAISTVSGGSIVGALYYLEVQELLKTREDSLITRKDYIEIVRRIQERFYLGVSENIRVKALSSFRKNWDMIFSKEYSRSHRIGELYEEELYSRVGKNDIIHREKRTMPQLRIKPFGWRDQASAGPTDFKPRYHNWRRRAKVPVLLLNTTSLNTGHSWHFTATWMGEPPGLVEEEIGTIARYRRLWYEEAKKDEHKNYRLGYAVAASAGVPGLFDPIDIEGLYPGRTVRLVDGGVHDNQGAQGLLDEGCTLILCSDASGQMSEAKRPSDSALGVPLRANSILQNRIRDAEYQDLHARVDSASLKGLFFVHLTKDLVSPPVTWDTGADNQPVPTSSQPKNHDNKTPYGIDRELQRKLSEIRTDLDSFTEVEANALMLSGYLMTEQEFVELDEKHRKDGESGTWGGFEVKAPRDVWSFFKLESLMGESLDGAGPRRVDIEKQIDAASAQFFKIWKLNPILKSLAIGGGILFFAGLVWMIVANWGKSFLNLTVGGLTISLVFALICTVIPFLKWIIPEIAWKNFVWNMAVAVFGWAAANIHQRIFNPLFLERGKLDRLLKLK
jgi:predicted acylesterase/phospholipase RssA